MTTRSDDSERISLAFLERYWSDRSRGAALPLSVYLRDFQGYEDVVVREYLAAEGAPERIAEKEEEQVSPGRIGPYRLVRELGRGGQGVVHLAEDTRLGRMVALKVFVHLGDLTGDSLQRFQREAEVASKLEHPGICPIYEAGMVGNVAYIAMRFVEGETLAKRLVQIRGGVVGDLSTIAMAGSDGPRTNLEGQAQEPYSPDVVLSPSPARRDLQSLVGLIADIALALHSAHEAGIIHRDIKPQNIMITENGSPVILDFGLARSDSAVGPELTRSGDVFGTPSYMAPEQIAGKRTDRRTDVYALGVTLYEGLTFRRPFEAPTRELLYRAITEKAPEDPRKISPTIPFDLCVIVKMALEKNPDQRYQSAQALADDLRAWLEHRPIAARPVSLAGRTLRWSQRHPARAALVAILAIAVPTVAALVGRLFAQAPILRAAEEQRAASEFEDRLENAFLSLYDHRFGDRSRSSRALPLFESLTEEAPHSVDARLGKALAYRWLGRWSDLLALVSSWSEKNGAAGAASLRVEALRRLGREKEAQEFKVPSAETPIDHTINAMTILGDPQTMTPERGRLAFDSMQAALALQPTRRRLFHYIWAQSAGNTSDPALARMAARVLMTSWPDEPRAAFYAGFCLQLAGLDADSIPAYVSATRSKGVNSDLHFNLGCAYHAVGDLERACASYEESLRLFPEDPAVLNNLAIALIESRKRDEAMIVLERWRAIDPEGLDQGLCEVRFFLEERELGPARKRIEALLARHPSDGDVLHEAARVADLEENRLEAIPLYRRALEAGADRGVQARSELGLALVRTGEVDEGLRMLREATESKDAEPLEWARLAMGHVVTKDPEGSIAAWRKALELAPSDVRFRNNYALALSAVGRNDEAVEEYELAAALAPDSDLIHNNLLEELQSIGDLVGLSKEMDRWDARGHKDAEGWLTLVRLARHAGTESGLDDAAILRAAQKAVVHSDRKDADALLVLAQEQDLARDKAGTLATLVEAELLMEALTEPEIKRSLSERIARLRAKTGESSPK